MMFEPAIMFFNVAAAAAAAAPRLLACACAGAAARRHRPRTMMNLFTTVLLLAGATFCAAAAAAAAAKPLKVVVMAGQSNMVGHGFAEGSTLHWNPNSKNPCGGTAGGCVDNMPNLPPNLNGSLLTPEFSFLGSPGKWKTHEGVWIVYNVSAADNGDPAGYPAGTSGYWHGDLSVGYGGVHVGTKTNHTEVGPELGFGWALGEAFKGTDQQVLIIKTSWGGKTIDIDFRPPSSAKANASHPVGPYYLWMLREIADALKKLPTLFPQYGQIGSYDLAGFVWQ